jgi:DNA polymerase III epsilon subunit-like protein
MKTRCTPQYIMVFDTETTGLPVRPIQPTVNKTPIKNELKSLVDFKTPEKYPIDYPEIQSIDNQPYMTQLSFIILDQKHNIIFHYNEYLKIPDSVEISPFITQLTGITKEISNNGVQPCEALKTFVSWFFKCERIVAHNIQFDRTIIRIEIARHYSELVDEYPYVNIVFSNNYDRVSQLDHFDTMIRGNKICGIMIPKKTGEGTKLKPPKLSEMYKIFFHKNPENLHNSMVDVLITTRCYLKLLSEHRDVDDGYFESLIEKAIHNSDINGQLIEFV